MKLGIRHERIEPAKPQQNGRHERMHLTLQQETASPPASSLRAHQRVFDRFRKEFNEERPHEALGLEVPATFYEPSRRPLPMRWPDFAYGELCVETRRLSKNGVLKVGNRSVRITSALGSELVGLRWNESTRKTEILFGPLLLGHLQRGAKNNVCFVGEKTSPVSLE
jgi:putative transposase